MASRRGDIRWFAGRPGREALRRWPAAAARRAARRIESVFRNYRATAHRRRWGSRADLPRNDRRSARLSGDSYTRRSADFGNAAMRERDRSDQSLQTDHRASAEAQELLSGFIRATGDSFGISRV